MKAIFIELCNYIDYPLGGHLSFAKHLTATMQGDLYLAGISTNIHEPIGEWYTKQIQGFNYPMYNVAYIERKSFKKPLIPTRIRDYFYLKRCISKLKLNTFELIIVQTPEVLFTIPQSVLHKVCLIMPGVENPLSISRYKIARNFCGIYDYFFFNRAAKVPYILAAADKEAIQQFINRSKGKIDKNRTFQFPTRYDSAIFHHKESKDLREKYNIDLKETIVVTTGRLNWFKGWKFMIDSFMLFKQHEPNAHLYFIGDGEDREKIETYISEQKCSSFISLLGKQNLNIVSDYLNMANLFIMGSYKEGWSTSLVEAVASAVPCVVTLFSSAKDMIEEGYNGFVLEDRNEKLFATKMKEALSINQEKIKNKAQWCEQYSVQNMRKQLQTIIKNI